MRCRNCGEHNPVGAAFCGSCGASFSAARASGDSSGHPAPPACARSDTTRYLCAAVQLNSKLADAVVEDIIDEEFKPPPMSPEVDLGPVLRHALAARSRQLVRDVALTLLLLVAVWAFLSLRISVLLLTAVLAWAVLFGEQLIATYGIVARQLRSDVFDPEGAPEPADARLRARLEDLRTAAQGNVTVYAGFVPFVGSGVPMDAWSFVLDVQRPAEGRTCTPFTTTDVHDAVLTRLQQLSLPGVRVEDRLFVDGSDLRGDGRFLPADLGPPTTMASPLLVRALIEQPDDTVRPYTCVRVAGWRGQLVLSAFIRFVATPQHLFVEVATSVLPPVLEEYQEVDRLLAQPTVRQLARIAGRSVLRTPVRWLLAPATVARAVTAPVTRGLHRSRQRREITEALRFNYGSSPSPRERAADSRYQRYFQQLDGQMHAKVVDRTVLEALVTFLDARGIDTAELLQRQTTILNNGVFVTGGATVTAQSMAAGAGAQATAGGRQRVAQAARAATPGANG